MTRIPKDYATMMQVMIGTLNDMPISDHSLSGTPGISILMGIPAGAEEGVYPVGEGAVCILLPSRPKSVLIDGKECVDDTVWDPESKTCRVRFDNSPDGVRVQIKWKKLVPDSVIPS